MNKYKELTWGGIPIHFDKDMPKDEWIMEKAKCKSCETLTDMLNNAHTALKKQLKCRHKKIHLIPSVGTNLKKLPWVELLYCYKCLNTFELKRSLPRKK